MPLRGSRTFFDTVIKSRTRSGDWKLCTNRFSMGHTIYACMEMIHEGKKQLTLNSRKRLGPMAQISRRNPSTVIILFLMDSLIFRKEARRGPRTQPGMDNWFGNLITFLAFLFTIHLEFSFSELSTLPSSSCCKSQLCLLIP